MAKQGDIAYLKCHQIRKVAKGAHGTWWGYPEPSVVPARGPRSPWSRGKAVFASENTNRRAVSWDQHNLEAPECHLRQAYGVWGKCALCVSSGKRRGQTPCCTCGRKASTSTFREGGPKRCSCHAGAGEPDNGKLLCRSVTQSRSQGSGQPFIPAASPRGWSEQSGATTTNMECHRSKDTCQMPFPYKHPHHDLC